MQGSPRISAKNQMNLYILILSFQNNYDYINYSTLVQPKTQFADLFKGQIRMLIMVSLTAVLHKDEDMYVARCPEVGTASQGKTVDEALSNLKEATELYLEEFPLKETDKPILTVFEITGYGQPTKEAIRA